MRKILSLSLFRYLRRPSTPPLPPHRQTRKLAIESIFLSFLLSTSIYLLFTFAFPSACLLKFPCCSHSLSLSPWDCRYINYFLLSCYDFVGTYIALYLLPLSINEIVSTYITLYFLSMTLLVHILLFLLSLSLLLPTTCSVPVLLFTYSQSMTLSVPTYITFSLFLLTIFSIYSFSHTKAHLDLSLSLLHSPNKHQKKHFFPFSPSRQFCSCVFDIRLLPAAAVAAAVSDQHCKTILQVLSYNLQDTQRLLGNEFVTAK